MEETTEDKTQMHALVAMIQHFTRSVAQGYTEHALVIVTLTYPESLRETVVFLLTSEKCELLLIYYYFSLTLTLFCF